MADDLGYGDTGVYGQKDILTPNIDRLAAEGMRFTQAYAPAPICAPTRCSLLTGFHVGHCTVNRNADPDLPLRVEDLTLGEVMEGAGYSTAWVGKWSLGGALTDGTPFHVESAPWNKGFTGGTLPVPKGETWDMGKANSFVTAEPRKRGNHSSRPRLVPRGHYEARRRFFGYALLADLLPRPTD